MKAFSIIELMVVIAIVALVTGAAVPAYSNYTKRAEVADILSRLGSFKNYVVEEYSKTGSLPPFLWFGTLESVTYGWHPSIGTSAVTGETGGIFANISVVRDLDFGTTGHADLYLFFKEENGVITWHCVSQNNSVHPSYMPKGCVNVF